MEITKANDIFVATLNNPNATTYDLMTLDLTPENTGLLTKDEYKQSKYVKDTFTSPEGKFDDLAFDNAFLTAANHYKEMTDDNYIKSLSEVQYSPFDVTRPKFGKTFNVNVEFSKDYNPFKETYSRTGINSINENEFSLRELAQQSKVYDPTTKTWSKESANDLSVFDKFFGDTLVYAQYDEEGTHIDPETGRQIKHKIGDWKVNEDGNLFLEKLGKREIYGKQIVNSMDLLTTDGSFANNFDFYDSDSREKSALKTTVKLAADIAPLLIPVFNTYYAGVRAAIGLSSVMPTFYKSFEGLLLGENQSSATGFATAAEGYMAKYSASSVSDAAQGSFFNYEQMGQLVADVFGQIYEQRAMASLSKYIVKNPTNLSNIDKEYGSKITRNILDSVKGGKIDINDADAIESIKNAAIEKIPSLKSFQKTQSQLAKTLSLGYMALTSTADIYGEAIQGGYDRRTAGFAALAAAAGQYGIMVNNRMGNWFLDKTTGYTEETNKALVRKTAKEYLTPIKEAFESKTKGETKFKLAQVFKNFKGSLTDTFTSPSELGEAMFKNSFIEGVEEVTEQAVLDTTKGVIDVLSYLGITGKQGSFGGWDTAFSKAGLENYLANFVGGILGGAMFEFNTRTLEPFLEGKDISTNTKQEIYKLVANGQSDLIIDELNKQRSKLGNNYIGVTSNQENAPEPSKEGISQADVIVDTAINMVKNIDGIMNALNLKHSDDNIIKKAMIDHLIIKDLNASKGDGKIGIEGIILDDFANSRNRVIEIQEQIQKISGNDKDLADNKEAIKELREESKIYENKIKDILEGKYAEKYYNQAIFYLSKPISESWLTIDKDTFSKNKYGVNFNSLPEKSLGLSKERIEKEWKEYLNSNDLRKNIEVATNAYLNLEKELNPSLEEYMVSGYDIQRARTYKLLIDLDSTIKMFNTATDDAQKENILSRFKYINDQLKETSSSSMNILPWEVYKQDIGKKIVEYGMVGKASTDESGNMLVNSDNGEVIGTPYSIEELENKNDAGLTLSDALSKQVSILFSEVPINPLNMDQSIKILNTMIYSNNQKIDKQILQIIQKPEQSEEDKEKIKELQSFKYDFVLIPYNNSKSIISKKEQVDVNISNLYNELTVSDGINQDIINSYKANNYYDFSDKNNNEEKEALKWLIDMDSSDITEEFVESLSEDQKLVFENSKLNSKLDQSKNLYNRLIEGKSNLDRGKLILEHEDKIKETVDQEVKLYNTFNDEINQSKPELLKMRNYALDLLLDEIKGTDGNSPSQDAEVINDAKKIVTNIVDGYKSQYFSNIKFDSIEDVMYIINNAKVIKAKADNSKFINITIEDEESGDINDSLDYSKQAIMNESFDDILKKYITDNSYENRIFFDSIEKLSKLTSDLSGLGQVNSFLKLSQELANKIENPLYKFLQNFELSLQKKRNTNSPSVFEILEREEKAILAASDINNFLTEGIKLDDVKNALNVLKLVKSVVYAMSTTQIGFDDPYGFIASRLNFVKKNNIESESSNLKTVTSDVAQLMILDLNRIETKLQFYLDLAKSNSEKIANEQETIRTQMNKIMYSKLKDLITLDVLKNIRPKFEDIDRNPNKSQERKLLELESLIYEEFKSTDKSEVLKQLLEGSNIKIDSRKLSKLTKEVVKEDINDYDFAIYLATILSVHSRDFNSKMHDIIENFDKAPFYTQELAMKISYGSLIDPKLFSTVVEFDTTSTEKNTSDLITYILGSGGTGKTTVVFKMLVKYLQRNNKSLNIWFVGPEKKQAVKLEKDVLENVEFSGTKETYDKISMYEKWGIRDEMVNIINDLKEGKDDSEYYSWSSDSNPRISLKEETLNIILSKVFKDASGNINQNLPSMIFIDEVTHFSSLELEIINSIIKSLPKENFIKIIAAGDTSQSGFKYGKDENAIELNVDRIKGIYSDKLLVSVRSANIWTRENVDLTTVMSEKVTDIFHNETLSEDQRKLKVSEILDVYKNEKLFNLKYHRSDNILNGHIIEPKLSDSVLYTLKNILSTTDKTLGILTESGNIEEYRESLTKLGLIDKDGIINPRITVFKLNSVQGNESDYFIFNTNVIKPVNPHHRLKDFYTYMSRAKDATIIIDENNKFSNEFNIINSSQIGTDQRQPLTDDVITKIRKNRIDTLSGLLDNDFKIRYDNFVFGSESLTLDEVNNSFLKKEDLTKTPLNVDTPDKLVEDDFNYMFHTFYNNPNIATKQILDSKGNVTNVVIDKITYDSQNSNSDLNIDGINENDSDKIVKGWLNIKNYYTYNKKLPSDSNSSTYLKSLFGSSVTPSKVKLSSVLTVSRYNSATNSPVYKEGFVYNSTLKDGDLFINVSLKLETGGKVHYITLSTLSANTINSAFGENSKSAELYKKVVEKLDKQNISKILEIAPVDFSNQITSLRFLKGIEVSTSVKDLTKKFPGLNRSDIEFFPTDKDAFITLMNKYSFGEKRSLEDIIKKDNDKTITIPGLNILFQKYKGKPYIKLSFNVNDLNGSESKDVQAKIVPLMTKSRSFDETKKDINKLRDIYFDFEKSKSEINKEERSKVAKSFKNLVSVTQFIDLLISVSEQFPEAFDGILEAIGPFKTVPLDYIGKFGSNKDKEIIKKDITNIFKKIKSLRGKDKQIIKAETWNVLISNTWKNYISQIFVLDGLVDSEQSKTKTPEKEETDTYNAIQSAISAFNNSLKAVSSDTGFYWETSKSSDKAVSTYNEGSSNKTDTKIEMFQPEAYLFINGVPESPRFLLNLEEIFNNYINESTPAPAPAPIINTVTKKTATKVKSTSKVNTPTITGLNKFNNVIQNLSQKTDKASTWRYEIAKLFESFTDMDLKSKESNESSITDWILSMISNEDKLTSPTFETFINELYKLLGGTNISFGLASKIGNIVKRLTSIYTLDKNTLSDKLIELNKNNQCKN